MGVRVVTDSTSYLPASICAEHRIEVVSLYVTFAEGDCVAERDLDARAFYSRLAASPGLPRSSQPAAAEIDAAFRRVLDDGDDVVGVFLSSEMSGTYESARAVRETIIAERPDAVIELVDSRSNCMQLGFTALAAAEAAEAGRSAAECAEAAVSVVARSRFLFTPATLEYLRRGGRIGNASALVGAVLQVRPILTVADGVTTMVRKVRTSKRAVEEAAAMCEADLDRCGAVEVAVHHIDAEETGRALAERFSARLGRDVPLVPIGAVIGTHVGPGAVGIVYVTRTPLSALGES